MNESIGGYDINGQWQPARMVADPQAAEIAHASGRVAHGAGLGQVAVIADVDFNIIEEHYDFRKYVLRNRVLRDLRRLRDARHVAHKGNAAPTGAARRFDTMNAWLARSKPTPRNVPQPQKLIDNKPALGGRCVLARRRQAG